MGGTYGVKLQRSAPLKLERHPLAPVRQSWRSWAEEQAAEGPIAIDLFSGAGGLSLGLENAGYTVVLAVDHDPAAIQTHLANFPGAALNMDLSDPDRVGDLLQLLEGLDIDLIAGGPPCQPFSRAGRSKIRDLVDKGVRERLDPRRELWRVLLRVAEELRPRAVLMENVPDMALGDDMRTVRYMTDRLESVGYETDMRILEAWRYGVPQHRQRLIFTGVRAGVFEWPKEREAVTLRQAINDLPVLRTTSGSAVSKYRGPKSDFQRRARVDVDPTETDVVFDHVTRPVRDDDREAFKLMTSGTRYSDLPEDLKRYRDDIFDDKYHRLAWDGWCRSITAHIAKDGYWYIHPSQQRTLTVREAARIQTFPDRFRFAGTRSDAFRLIGNAVPPMLGEVIGTELLASSDRSFPEGHTSGAQQRAAIRTALVKWVKKNRGPLWCRPGEPWSVLVAVVAGKKNATRADRILSSLPRPETVNDRRVTQLIGKTDDDREKRALHALLGAAKVVNREGWQDSEWAHAAGLGPADAKWVETVGLGLHHVATSAGTLRVSGRLFGQPGLDGVAGRVLLGQLVGYGDTSTAVTAALAALAEDACQPTGADCGRCPLRSLCQSADRPAVA